MRVIVTMYVLNKAIVMFVFCWCLWRVIGVVVNCYDVIDWLCWLIIGDVMIGNVFNESHHKLNC